MRRKPKEICSYTSECQGDKSRVISLSVPRVPKKLSEGETFRDLEKEGIFRGVGIFDFKNIYWITK